MLLPLMLLLMLLLLLLLLLLLMLMLMLMLMLPLLCCSPFTPLLATAFRRWEPLMPLLSAGLQPAFRPLL